MRILITLLFVFFLISFISAQKEQYQHYEERINMPYLAPDKSKGNSPAYTYSSDIFFFTQVNIDSLGRNKLNDAANEPSIAINPLNPNEMMIGWRQFDNIQSDFRQAGRAYTVDGGFTWINQAPIEPEVFRSDPVLDYDRFGNFYYNSLKVENWPDAPAITNQVFRSTAPGQLEEGIEAFGGDKQWMTVDKLASEPNVYCSWRNFRPFTCAGEFSRSIGGGRSFEACVNPYFNSIEFVTLDIGPNQELYIAGWIEGSIALIRSLNAANKNEEIIWEAISIPFLDGSMAFGSRVNPQGLIGQVEIGVDRSGGATNGFIYILAPVNRASTQDPSDVMFVRSRDGGSSWDDPIRINNDPDNRNVQWLPTMSVAPNGRIDVVWLDTRNALNGINSELYYSFSEDGGSTWSANYTLSESFDPSLGYPQQQKMGDYFDLESINEGAHLAWAGTFNNEQDVYYGFITPPLTTSTDDFFANTVQLEVYPNPSSITPSIELKGLEEKVDLSLYQMNGQLLFRTKNVNNTTSSLDTIFDINVPLEAGIYFIQARSKDGATITKKLIII